MTDIYYCSATKNKNKHACREKSEKVKHNNKNLKTCDNICGRHTSFNERANWNAKTSRDTSVPVLAAPQKVYHNTRCTRHHKSHAHHHNSSSMGSINGEVNQHKSRNHSHSHNHNHHNHSNGHRRKSESVLSTDSDIRFTRRKLGDSQKCGCAVVAVFLIALLVASAFIYVGYTYFRPEPLSDRVFRGKFLVLNDKWSMDLADQNSLRFQQKARDYRDRINLLVRGSDLKEAYAGSEILALDGTDDTNDIIVHFNMIFDPYVDLVSAADLLALFAEGINSPKHHNVLNMKIKPESLTINEVTGLIEEPIISSSPLGNEDDPITELIVTTPKPPRTCAPLKLSLCRAVGYNMTTYPNLLGHQSLEEVQTDVIAFRELVDAECFREAFDFVCRLLQPPCESHANFEPTPGVMCREYCQLFMRGCGSRLPERFKLFFDCEEFPESTGIQSCHQKPHCANDLQNNAYSPRLCDGFADCPDLSDERTCTFCTTNTFYCGRGRACAPRKARCDGKLDCPDGADEKDCLSIAPLASELLKPQPLVPYLPRFHSEGYAVFSEKGVVGKLCSEGLEGESKLIVRQTVAESLCKSLGYESLETFDVRNDTEQVDDYVRVLDPHAAEISFIRTHCPKRQVLYVACGSLQCGIQSVLATKQYLSLPKISSPGDWPWLVALYREDVHVCDGTLVSHDWVLTTESCFQGQPRATWLAIFGTVRLSSNAPWTQRRRIIGMIKSPVEGSTAALIRLETPVVFSDHVRPICLPDEVRRQQEYKSQRRLFPSGEEHSPRSPIKPQKQQRLLAQETQEFFSSPDIDQRANVILAQQAQFLHDTAEAAPQYMPRPEAFVMTRIKRDLEDSYPLPSRSPQVKSYHNSANVRSANVAVVKPLVPESFAIRTTTTSKPTITPSYEQGWTNCNTLGWSRQRDHLQRVQLKIGDMAPCENISIATVNSMCTEATYQKHDCTQEEFSGAPVQCLIPGTNQWALIGVSSWRIACSQNGVERPRMYDKITSNAAWIREILSAAT